MNDFVRCNKVSGVYWLKSPVDDIKISIKLKPPDDILSLPKFEDFINESSNIHLESSTEEYSFNWQEKSFSQWEVQRFSDVHNCLTETELKYHETLKNNEITPNKVFTYIHEDYHTPLPVDYKVKKSKLECWDWSEAVGRIGASLGGKTSSTRHLFKSKDDVSIDERWISMHFVMDNSDYDENSQLLLKKETILLSLYHNIDNNFLILTPDVNCLESNPYTVNDVASSLGHKYEVKVEFGELENNEELVLLLRKLYKKWEKSHRSLLTFVTPQPSKVNYYINLDIVSAKDFEMDNLYIDYNIKLSEGTECKDTLRGKTHTSESTTDDETPTWHFGHLIELSVEANSDQDPPPSLHLYLEAISVDWWQRHRTEGYGHHLLQLSPGFRTLELPCVRPRGGWRDEERRFFVGGCHLVKDVEVFANPDMQSPNIKYTTTGSIQVRCNMLKQSCAPGAVQVRPAPSTASALLMGAETALRKYKKARARLAAATRDISSLAVGGGDATDDL